MPSGARSDSPSTRAVLKVRVDGEVRRDCGEVRGFLLRHHRRAGLGDCLFEHGFQVGSVDGGNRRPGCLRSEVGQPLHQGGLKVRVDGEVRRDCGEVRGFLLRHHRRAGLGDCLFEHGFQVGSVDGGNRRPGCLRSEVGQPLHQGGLKVRVDGEVRRDCGEVRGFLLRHHRRAGLGDCLFEHGFQVGSVDGGNRRPGCLRSEVGQPLHQGGLKVRVDGEVRRDCGEVRGFLLRHHRRAGLGDCLFEHGFQVGSVDGGNRRPGCLRSEVGQPLHQGGLKVEIRPDD